MKKVSFWIVAIALVFTFVPVVFITGTVNVDAVTDTGPAGGEMVPHCSLCNKQLDHPNDIGWYYWKSPQGGEIVKQLWYCNQCGFNNNVDKFGIVELDLNTWQTKINVMEFKKFNGITFVPDWVKVKQAMSKQVFPIKLKSME